MNIIDVAREAEVSPSTVSNVFSNKPVVKEKTRLKVIEVAKRLNYTANMIASSTLGQCQASGH